MKQLGLGTIGTSMITDQFIEAAQQSGNFLIKGVYSRGSDKAEAFKAKHQAEKAFSDWEIFLEDPSIDVVYIASPNSLHFEQAKQVIQNKKHAIVEKPIVASLEQWEELMALGDKMGVVVVEAARHIFEPNFVTLTEMIKTFDKIQGATLTYSKYSSRYDNVLAGEEPPIFSPEFSGGAANDLGIYVIYAALRWFGEPNSVHSFAQKIRTGVDGKGITILRYDDFDVSLHYGKITTSLLPSEIYTQDQTLVLDAITGVEKAELVNAKTSEKEKITLAKPSTNPLIWEANAFAEVITDQDNPENKKRLAEWSELSYQVHKVLEEIRKQSKS